MLVYHFEQVRQKRLLKVLVRVVKQAVAAVAMTYSILPAITSILVPIAAIELIKQLTVLVSL